MGGEVLLLAFSSRDVCVFGLFSALFGAWVGIVLDVSRSSGKWLLSAKCVATLRNDGFFILSDGVQFSTIFLHGLSSSILLYLSIVRAVNLSLRSLKGSTFASM